MQVKPDLLLPSKDSSLEVNLKVEAKIIAGHRPALPLRRAEQVAKKV